MINLFDDYSQKSRDLHHSLRLAGYDNRTFVVNDEGFLPDNVMSPYAYYINLYEGHNTGVYFNQVLKPDYWEIRGTNAQGGIYYQNEKRANIVYESTLTNGRIVKRVEWVDRYNHIRSVDYYGRTGWRFANTSYNAQGKPILTTYCNEQGQEIIVENYETKDIILNQNNQILFFKTRVAFIKYFLKNVVGEIEHMIYNSLSIPFLVAYELDYSGSDILIWQETLPNDGHLPGNMVALLNNQKRASDILFQDQLQASTFKSQHASFSDRADYLGNVYEINANNQHNVNDALILTNSDRIEHLEKLITALPKMHFHIAAATEMSAKLTSLAGYDNVSLYPNISSFKVRELQQQCAIYLDINHGREFTDATRQAFMNNQLIWAFTETKHSDLWVSPATVVDSHNLKNLIDRLQNILQHQSLFDELVAAQQQHGGQTLADVFRDTVRQHL